MHMNRMEKIAFIRSYWSMLQVYEDLEAFQDDELNSIINGIITKMKTSNSGNAVDQVIHMPVYLN
jgi:hypothetical protein